MEAPEAPQDPGIEEEPAGDEEGGDEGGFDEDESSEDADEEAPASSRSIECQAPTPRGRRPAL